MDTNHSPNIPHQIETELGIRAKAKRTARITAITIPILFIFASMGVIGHAGVGGIVMIIIYIPLSFIVALILRFLLAPYYKVVLDKNANSLLRKVMIGAGMILAAVFMYLLYQTAFFPYSSVNDAVKEIPEMQAYFFEHKDEFERQRLQAYDKNFEICYDEKSNGSLTVRFCYGETSETTGYKAPYRYVYLLDDHWYIEIYLRPAI